MCGHASLKSEFPAAPPRQSGIASFAAAQTEPADRRAGSQRPGGFVPVIRHFSSPPHPTSERGFNLGASQVPFPYGSVGEGT